MPDTIPKQRHEIAARIAVLPLTGDRYTEAELVERVTQALAECERRAITYTAPRMLDALAGDRRKRADKAAPVTPAMRQRMHEAAGTIEEVADLLRHLGPALDVTVYADTPLGPGTGVPIGRRVAPRRDWLTEEMDRQAAAGIPNLDNAGDGTVDGPGEDDLR